ncbi:hypothetical protein [Symbioplanes lichenis]|uniref:hypothetical protein n=1 Tax=Symbioplanes lichenis TaxID=1629072 RepID=UPI00273A4DB8|nr:hypothetical protein [Actinoplanes lichenis]
MARECTHQAQAAGAYLLQLLRDDVRYRARWRCGTDRHGHGDVNQAAVAGVIQEYLWDAGERSETDTALRRRLKDRVSRALTGASLSAETLRWFVKAFTMTDHDAAALWALLEGREAATEGVSHTLSRHREMVSRQRHRTVTSSNGIWSTPTAP